MSYTIHNVVLVVTDGWYERPKGMILTHSENCEWNVSVNDTQRETPMYKYNVCKS